MTSFYKNLLIGLVAASAIGGMFLLDPIPQNSGYHDFTEQARLLGIPNFWNVATNLPFLVAGALGLIRFRQLASMELATHYRVFCAAVLLIAFGSA